MRIHISIETFKYILLRNTPSLAKDKRIAPKINYLVKAVYEHFQDARITEQSLIKRVSKLEIYTIQEYFKKCCKYTYDDLSNIELFEFIIDQAQDGTIHINVYQDVVITNREPNRIDNYAFEEYRKKINKPL